jgi:hypothetical protein
VKRDILKLKPKLNDRISVIEDFCPPIVPMMQESLAQIHTFDLPPSCWIECLRESNLIPIVMKR